MTKPDGRKNNGAKKGESRNQGRKPVNQKEGKRVKWALTFLPSHFAAIEAQSDETGISKVQIVEDALKLYYSQKENQSFLKIN